MDLSPWSINGHSLNLRECNADICLDEVNFDVMRIWIQVYGLSLDMYNGENARRIAGMVGRCMQVEKDHIMQNMNFLRLQVELDTTQPLKPGFWWKNSRGVDKWASFKYERIANFCYACGKLGHTSQTCGEEMVMSESRPGFPLYGPWFTGERPPQSGRHYWLGGRSPDSSL